MVDHSAEINSLSDSINYMWQPTKNKLDDQATDVALLKTFFKNWKDGVDAGETPQEAYDDAIEELPDYNPNIPNSEVTEDQLWTKISWALGKNKDDIDLDDVEDLAETLEKDMATLHETVKKYLALGFFCDSQIHNLEEKIEQINSQSNSEGPMYGESPDAGYEDNLLS